MQLFSKFGRHSEIPLLPAVFKTLALKNSLCIHSPFSLSFPSTQYLIKMMDKTARANQASVRGCAVKGFLVKSGKDVHSLKNYITGTTHKRTNVLTSVLHVFMASENSAFARILLIQSNHSV